MCNDCNKSELHLKRMLSDTGVDDQTWHTLTKAEKQDFLKSCSGMCKDNVKSSLTTMLALAAM